MDNEIPKVGDTVQLWSGGPVMTVTRVNAPDVERPNGLIAVAWFSDGGTLFRDAFDPGALRVRTDIRASVPPQ